MKTEFVVVDPILSFPESFDTFSRAEVRAKEMAESEPGKPVKIYELTGEVVAPVGPIQSLRVYANGGSGNGFGQRLIQSAKEARAGYKRGPYKKKPSLLRIMNEIGLPIKEIPVKAAKKTTGKRKYTKKASYWDNPIKKKRRKKRA